MPLSKIDDVRGVDFNQFAPKSFIGFVQDSTGNAKSKLAEVNNECVKLRTELQELKRTTRETL